MATNNDYDPLSPIGPPSPRLDPFPLTLSPQTEEPEPLYNEYDAFTPPTQQASRNLGDADSYQGVPQHDDDDPTPTPSIPRHHTLPSSAPNLDDMPVPVSLLPPGALPPERYYSALGTEDLYSRQSYASSIPTLNELGGRPRPGFATPSNSSRAGWRDSDYNSVSRLPVATDIRASYAGTYGADDGSGDRHLSTSLGGYDDSFRDDHHLNNSIYPMDNMSGPMDDSAVVAHHATLEDKRAQYMAPNVQKRKRIRNIVIGALAVLLALAVALGALYFFVLRKHSSNKDNTTSGGGSGSSLTGGSPTRTSSGASPSNTVRVTGGDGSVVTFEDGSTMVYRNSFAGTWYYDPNDPFNNNAQAQSWTPPLNTTFKFGTNKIRGVNLGGWLNTEPFISPALYEKYLDASTPAIDEWTLSTNMAADKASGGLGQLENHYATFITEEDFALIAAAGLNFVRIPFPYWAISVFPGEPFLEGTAWKYFLKAIQWARKYGIRINLDLHAIPGSQNAFNHSGKFGLVNWLYGTMGLANAQRSLDIIRILVEFISQLQYSPVIPVFGLVNEPLAPSIGIDVLGSFYLQAYYMIRNITGVGTGKGPFITIHDGFLPINGWYGFLSGADRIMLDTHPYLCFQALDPSPPSQQAGRPCGAWAGRINQTMQNFGMVNAGEWSLGYTDCGLFLNGVGLGTRYEGNLSTFPSTRIGSCAPVLDWENYNQSTKSGLMAFGLAQMDVLQNWFFWTWKIGNSSVSGRVESPHWSYRLGWENGWLPKDPRSASGVCASQGVTTLWTPPLAAWQTGGQGAGTIAAGQLQTYGAWPPTTMSPSVNNVQALPQYTPTGSLPTLPVPTFTGSVASTVSPGDGWYDSSDTVGYYTSIQGCSYPNGWSAVSAPIPTGCGGSARKRNGGQVVAAAAAGPPWATITPSPRLR